MSEYKIAKTLTPGEKREKAKENARKEVKNLRDKARRMKSEIEEIKTKVTKPSPGKKGRVIEPERVAKMEKPLRDIANENVLFKPNDGPQTEFLAAPETDVLYGGAAGGGKSFAMLVDPLRYAHLKEHRALILRKTMPELRELIDKSRELYPKAFPGCKFKEVEKVWTFPSGAKIEFGFLEKDSDVYRYQGQAYSWIGFDEITHLASEFPWNYLASRLRTTNPDIIPYLRCTANPGGIGHSWVKKRYVEPAKANTKFVRDGIDTKFIPARLEDNPYLTQDGRYEQMLKSLPEVHRRRLLEGDWDVTEGAAFPEFDIKTHTVQPFDIPVGWNRIKSVDYGYTSPSCCLWGAINPEDGTIFIYRELYERGLVAEELAEKMTERERDEYRSIPGVLDTAAWNKTGYTGPTIGELLCRGPYGHKLRPADKNRKAGKIQIHQYLKVQGDVGKPLLLIFDTCTNLIREMQTIPLSETDSEDVDTHAEDHAYDALRYMLMSRPRKESPHEIAFRFKQEAGFLPADSTFGY